MMKPRPQRPDRLANDMIVVAGWYRSRRSLSSSNCPCLSCGMGNGMTCVVLCSLYKLVLDTTWSIGHSGIEGLDRKWKCKSEVKPNRMNRMNGVVAISSFFLSCHPVRFLIIYPLSVSAVSARVPTVVQQERWGYEMSPKILIWLYTWHQDKILLRAVYTQEIPVVMAICPSPGNEMRHDVTAALPRYETGSENITK